MDPKDIAQSIEEPEGDFQTCPNPDCRSPYFSTTGSNVYCPRKRCKYYNKSYHDALFAALLPNGIHDYDSLVQWFKLYVPIDKVLENHDSIEDAIAWMTAFYEADSIDWRKKDIAYFFYDGMPGYKNDPEGVRDKVNELFADDEYFFPVFEDHFGIYQHRED